MTPSPLLVSQFYSSAKPATQPKLDEKPAPSGTLAAAAGDFVQTLQNGEQTAKAAMTGGADMPSLVEALAKSELAVETAVTVRNKVVQAYQEILRMPV